MKLITIVTYCFLACTLYVLQGCAAGKTVSPANAVYTTPEQYETARKALLRADSLRSFDASVRLTAKEALVNKKLADLQSRMLRQYDSVQFFPPAHYFYKSARHMYSTELFGILKKMPKGGI